MSNKNYSYIYQITNKLNNKKYIGKTLDLEGRMKYHFASEFNKCEPQKILYKAIRKYGNKNFKIKILWEGFATNEHLNNLEIFFIAYYNTNIRNDGYGYNLTFGGDGGPILSGKQSSFYKMGQKGLQKGQNNPCSKTNMSKEKRDKKAILMVETRKKMNSFGNGSKNGRALKLLLISPEGKHHYLNGKFMKFCKDNNLSYYLLNKNIGKDKITIKYYKKGNHNTLNCLGWEIKHYT